MSTLPFSSMRGSRTSSPLSRRHAVNASTASSFEAMRSSSAAVVVVSSSSDATPSEASSSPQAATSMAVTMSHTAIRPARFPFVIEPRLCRFESQAAAVSPDHDGYRRRHVWIDSRGCRQAGGRSPIPAWPGDVHPQQRCRWRPLSRARACDHSARHAQLRRCVVC